MWCSLELRTEGGEKSQNYVYDDCGDGEKAERASQTFLARVDSRAHEMFQCTNGITEDAMPQ